MHTITQTDDTLREMRDHGTHSFPFQHYSLEYAARNICYQFTAWHWHTELEFFYVESGVVEYYVGEDKIILSKGECAFINSRAIHRGDTRGGIYHAIVFSPELIAPFFSTVYRKYVHPFMTEGLTHLVLRPDGGWKSDLLRDIEEICRISTEHSDMEELAIQLKVVQLWMKLIPHLSIDEGQNTQSVNMLQQARLRQMMQYIWDHYDERITLEDIAGAANVSKSAALRCFQAGVQTSPIGYLNDYRLEYACDLLLLTQDSVSDIALCVGFESTGYFDRMFKRALGITPKQYRKQMQEIHGDTIIDKDLPMPRRKNMLANKK